MITNTTSDYTSGNAPLTKTPMALEALKRTLQELLGSGSRWYGTLTKGCVIAWIIGTTGPEEMIASTEEMKTKEEEKERKQKRKKTKERAGKKGKECGTTPTH
jgi:hypothetical protein